MDCEWVVFCFVFLKPLLTVLFHVLVLTTSFEPIKVILIICLGVLEYRFQDRPEQDSIVATSSGKERSLTKLIKHFLDAIITLEIFILLLFGLFGLFRILVCGTWLKYFADKRLNIDGWGHP